MTEDKGIHFGRWVQWARLNKGMSRDEFAPRVGVSNRQLAKIESASAPTSFESTLTGIAGALGMTLGQMMERWPNEPVPLKPARPGRGKKISRDSADGAAIARMLRGEPVMQQQLMEAAENEGVTLLELYRRITREWLAVHTAGAKPFRGVHTGLDKVKRPPANSASAAGSAPPPAEPARARRAAGRPGRGEK